MKTIVVIHDPYIYSSEIHIYSSYDQEPEIYEASSNINYLADAVVTLAYDQGITNVKYHGYKDIADEFKEAIIENEHNIYAVNKIKVEVI